MKNYLIGIGTFIAAMSILVGTSAMKNYDLLLDRSGADENAERFARSCKSDMKVYTVRFHFGTPAIAPGCVCIGVKLQERGAFETHPFTSYSDMYSDFLLENRSNMHPRLRGYSVSSPGNQVLWKDIPYSNKPKLISPAHHSPETKHMSSALMQSFNYCSQYTLDGADRVIVSRLPKRLQ